MNTCSLSKKCLFGGVLLSAGLSAQHASAQAQFVNTYTSMQALSLDYNNGAYSFATDAGAGARSASSYLAGSLGGNTGSWAVVNNSNYMGTGAWAYGPYLVSQSVTFASYFNVTQDGTATWSFDPSGDVNYQNGYNYFELTDITNATTLILHDWNSGPQSGTVALDDANNYVVRMYCLASDFGGGGGLSNHWLTIPTPGPVALLGIAGLVAARRRR